MRWIKLYDPKIMQEPDFIRLVKVEGKKICLVKSGNQIYATQNRCPHAGGDLSQGWCKKGKLICPIHRYEYDLASGRGASGQGDYINTYPIEIRLDGIYIGLKESWLKLKKLFPWMYKSSK